MDNQLVRAYRDNWRVVAARQAEERRTESVALRWRQLNALLSMAMALGLPLHRSHLSDDAVVRRWAVLKGACDGRAE